MAAKIKKGDRVLVRAGDYKGSIGVVLKVFPEESKVLVDDVNARLVRVRTANGVQTKRKNFPIHISNVSLFIEGENPVPTRVFFSGQGKDKKRCSAKTREEV